MTYKARKLATALAVVGLVEMGLDTGTASLVAVADGTTSLHLSTGGGVIGGGEHQAVRRVSEAFLHTAEAHLDRLQPISEAPLPQTGTIRFHALTFDSLQAPRSRKANSSTAEANWHRCSTPATRSLPSSGSSTSSGSDRDPGA